MSGLRMYMMIMIIDHCNQYIIIICSLHITNDILTHLLRMKFGSMGVLHQKL